MANEPLRYMAARDVDNGAQTFGMVVRSPDGAPLGRLEGFMIDPNSQTLRYYVVDVRKGRRLMRKMVPSVPAWLPFCPRAALPPSIRCLHCVRNEFPEEKLRTIRFIPAATLAVVRQADANGCDRRFALHRARC